MVHQLPSFQTSRLLVRPRTTDDLEACLEMDRDPQVTRFIAGPWLDPIAHRAFVEARMRHLYPVGMGYWSVIASAKFVGWVLLTPLDLHGPEIEIGWRLLRSAWGLGYATEAARPILDHALTALKVEKVVADIDPMNTASASVARKLGFRSTGSTLYSGREVTRYAIERTNFAHQRG
jgi:RimJ/RimL family protein N-acetyltransferase